LSRQSIFTLFAGLVLVFIFHTMRARSRWQAVGSVALLIVFAFCVPFVRQRILVSFGSSDVSGVARTESLGDFTGLVSGHWLFGLGWARTEIIDPATSYAVNLISNSPLLQIYRGGLVAGLGFLAVILIACIMSYRALRSDSLPFAVYGGVFIAFCIVALNLDHGVTDVPQTTLCFSVFLAFVGYIDRSRRRAPDPAATVTSEMPAAAGRLETGLGASPRTAGSSI
jgi:polysaccharide biosynthesis protein PslJ